MKRSKQLILITLCLLLSLACILPEKMVDLFWPVLSQFPDLAEEESGPEHDDFFVEQHWTCSSSDLRSYLGDKWQAYQTLNLDMLIDSRKVKSRIVINFRTESQFLVKRDPDSWAPPGATQVPEGEYKLEELFHGTGDLILNDGLYLGTTNVDYTITTHFPEPVVTEGKIGYRTVGHFVSDSVLEICLDVYEGGYEDAVNDPFNQLAPNCRWPGYIFTCTPRP